MPNWCENQLSIYGPKEEVTSLFEKIKKPVVDHENQEFNILENLYPTPSQLLVGNAATLEKDWSEQQKINNQELGYSDWYGWRNENWGTKWGDCETHLAQTLTASPNNFATVAFSFDTAWAPPIEAFHKIASDYPKILFCLYYQEPGMGFCGKNVWANGECQEQESADLITDYFDEEYLYETYNTQEEEENE